MKKKEESTRYNLIIQDNPLMYKQKHCKIIELTPLVEEKYYEYDEQSTRI